MITTPTPWTRLTTWMVISYGLGLMTLVFHLCGDLFQMGSRLTGYDFLRWCIQFLESKEYRQYRDLEYWIIIAGITSYMFVLSTPAMFFLRFAPLTSIRRRRFLLFWMAAVVGLCGIVGMFIWMGSYVPFGKYSSHYRGFGIWVCACLFMAMSGLFAALDLSDPAKVEARAAPASPS